MSWLRASVAAAVAAALAMPMALAPARVSEAACGGAPCVPEIISMAPLAGLPSGGTVVVINGAGISGVTAVTFGTTPAASFNGAGDYFQITAVSPPHAAGIVDVRVTNSLGTSAISIGDQFTFSPPAPCTAVSASSYPMPPGFLGDVYMITANASTCPGAQYEFWVLLPKSTWQLAQAYSSNTTMQVVSVGSPAGTIEYSVWAKDSSSAGTLGDALGRWDAYKTIPYFLDPWSCTYATAGAAPVASAPIGTTVLITAQTGDGLCFSTLFEFWLLAPRSTWQLVQPYSLNSTFSWNTAGWSPGVYQVSVWAKESTGTGLHSSSYGRYDTYYAFSYTLTRTPCRSVTVGTSPPSPSPSSGVIAISGSASTCTAPMYEFWMLSPGSSAWKKVQSYSSNAIFNWDGGDPPGTYKFSVWARDSSSTGTSSSLLGRWDATTTVAYTLTPLPLMTCTGAAVSVAPPSGTAPSGTTVTMDFSATGCTNPRYELWMESPGSSAWQRLSGYHSSATFNWNSSGMAAGAYSFKVLARDASSPGANSDATLGRWDAEASFAFSLTSTPCTSVTATRSPAASWAVNGSVTMTGSASGCPNPQYEFWVLPTGPGNWFLLRPYSSIPTAIWNILTQYPGQYSVSVWARDASSVGTAGDSFGRWDSYAVVSGTVT